jgi:hypothetical protein
MGKFLDLQSYPLFTHGRLSETISVPLPIKKGGPFGAAPLSRVTIYASRFTILLQGKLDR